MLLISKVFASKRPPGPPGPAPTASRENREAAESGFRGTALTGLFLYSGSHGQFKRPERSFTLEAEESTGSLSPLTSGESDQCPRQSPCRLQSGYDQPGLFQGKKLVGVIM